MRSRGPIAPVSDERRQHLLSSHRTISRSFAPADLQYCHQLGGTVSTHATLSQCRTLNWHPEKLPWVDEMRAFYLIPIHSINGDVVCPSPCLGPRYRPKIVARLNRDCPLNNLMISFARKRVAKALHVRPHRLPAGPLVLHHEAFVEPPVLYRTLDLPNPGGANPCPHRLTPSNHNIDEEAFIAMPVDLPMLDCVLPSIVGINFNPILSPWFLGRELPR